MCLLFVYINPNPTKDQYKLIVVNNRDELYERPTQPATVWKGEPTIIAGTDLQQERAGGTWLGLADTGRISSLLNIFKPRKQFKNPKDVEGRGFLVVDYLRGKLSGEQYLQQLAQSSVCYNDFNIVIMEPDTTSSNTQQQLPYKLMYFNNFAKNVVSIGPGVHGFGNTFYNNPIKKVGTGIEKLEKIIEDIGLSTSSEERMIEALLAMMQDREPQFPDQILMQLGSDHPQEFVKQLSSIYVESKHLKYGTRTTSVVLVDGSNKAVFRERTMKDPINLDNTEWQVTHHRLNLKL